MELTMKMIAAVPVALLTLAALGCSQHASTAPTVDRPAAATASSDTNTFGESKDEATGSAASARDATFGSEPTPADATANGASPPASPASADPNAPK
jgi:hypothetical protein